ncbi:type I restriction-modification system subunit M N-terminal domain-containing protein [Comamonas jiangduensis]|uniref:type I restriction-modification system subunit M N-terminal domain-containing protein n=1 Tax=Comamonas jiangduensis TaxID=1194168 RepID=UPI003BF8721E
MTSQQQRAELQRRIWAIANDVRGAVDGWDFKQYVLGTLFYRFISENFANYIEGGDDSVDYAALSDAVITPDIREDAIKTKGYFIYPSQLFVTVAQNAVSVRQSHLEIDPVSRHRVHDEHHAHYGERHDRPAPQAALLLPGT